MREAVIHVSDRDLGEIGLGAVISALRRAGLKDLTELQSEGIHQVRVEDPIPEEILEGLDAVKWWEKLDESVAGTTYVWELRIPDCEAACPLTEHSTAYEVSAVRQRGIDLSIIGSQGDLGRTIERLVEAGMNVDLERLTEYHGSEMAMDRLTDRQREVVRTAHSMGYYDVPRAATTNEVAEAIGLDPSTVAEHLQRAERNLMGDILVAAD